MVIALRQAQPEDADAIRAVVRAAYALYLDRMDREPAPMLANYPALVAKGVVTVAEDEGRIAGILVCYPRGDALHVENVAVAPDFQGRGIGKRLMDRAEDEARSANLDRIDLYTNEVMRENIAFYEELGFLIRDQALQDGYARIFFEKRLDDDASG